MSPLARSMRIAELRRKAYGIRSLKLQMYGAAGVAELEKIAAEVDAEIARLRLVAEQASEDPERDK